MDRLPAELLTYTADLVEFPDLLSLSLTSKALRSASAPSRLRVIKLRFASQERLSEAIAAWTAVLVQSGSFSYVHQLEILGEEYHSLGEFVDFAKLGMNSAQPLEPWKYSFVRDPRVVWPTDAPQWKELLGFIQSLPAIEHLLWASREQIPPCIVRYLHHLTPVCRLHMENFRLDSLLVPRDQPVHISSADLEIARSPALYSISKLEYTNVGGSRNFTDDAILEMAAGAAPNLKRVHQSRRGPPGANYMTSGAPDSSVTEWPAGLVHSAFDLGSLEVLVLEGANAQHCLQTWSQHTDFTMLKTLKVYETLSDDQLIWLTTHHAMKNLEELAIRGESLKTEGLILSLPPLTRLQLLGTNEELQI
ncbi:uncharacterized protein LOC136066136, partial [Quercus suber]|uniref:uncharacterized protein LOC136066136 n=1 Tax=Quercus suber TaxID=58331 RepID=UPI0032DF2143